MQAGILARSRRSPAKAAAPTAQETETLDRIAGQPQPLPAVFTEKGNLWPSEPPRVLTLADLRRDHVFIVRHRPQRGGYGLCRTGARPGVALGIC